MLILNPARILWCVECSGVQFLKITILSSSVDLSTATGGFFHYQLPASVPILWPATIHGIPSVSSVTLVHAFITGDLTPLSPKNLDLTPLVTLAGQSVRYPATLFRLPVIP